MYWRVLQGVPGAFSSLDWKTPNSLSLSSQERYSSSLTIFIAVFVTLDLCLLVGTPEMDTVFHMVSYEGTGEGENHLPWSADHTAFDMAQNTVGWAAGGHLSDTELFTHKHHQVFLPWAHLSPFSTQTVLVLGTAPQTSHLALLNLVCLLFAEPVAQLFSQESKISHLLVLKAPNFQVGKWWRGTESHKCCSCWTNMRKLSTPRTT